MSDQARIETAIDTTIDNCEVLRARLAKYEDAEGRPITTITEQAREIERLRMQLVACGVVALANTPESAAKARDMHPDYMSASCGDVIRTVDIQMQLRAELAELKAQPSGVALPLMAALESVVHDERVPNEVSQEVAAVLIEARRLNSSPVSAGGVDERAAFEAWRHEKFCGGVERLKKCSNAPDVYYYTAEQEAWKVWQARAALSAPSHGEQAREGWKLVPVEPTPEMISAASGAITKPDDLPPVGDGGWSMSDLAFRSRYRAAIAAAPSLASQKEQG